MRRNDIVDSKDIVHLIENVKGLSLEDQMGLAQANKEICDAQLQLEEACQTVKNIVMGAKTKQQKTTFLFKL